MVDTPGKGLPDWAALAASRRPKKPKPRGFVVPTKPQASASSPRILSIQPEAGEAEKITSHDAPHEGAGERTEFAALLKKWIGIGDNRTFEPNELAEIRREISELRAEVSFLTELNLEQQEVLNQSLEEIQSGSERLGRKDWLTYVIGVGTSLVIAEIVPPLALLPLAVHAFHALSHLLTPANLAPPPARSVCGNEAL
jgi:hypothetical protein